MQTITAQQHETVDELVYRITGSTAQVEAVYQANQNLADLGPHLPHGTTVIIPDANPQKTQTVKRQTLW
jgi:phage tail protein X